MAGMDRHEKSRPLIAIIAAVLLTACGSRESARPPGTLEISFSLEDANGLELEPSYQTVIWLEDRSGSYVRTLLVSEYLSYGGYEDPEICSRWSRSCDWGNVSEAHFDAVTRATPPPGDNTITIDCAHEKLAPGVYHYCVQTHIMEEDNILFRGLIEIGGGAKESRAAPGPPPDKHPAARHLLGNVKAIYRPRAD